MQTVVEIVNLIRARALNYRTFQNHLATSDTEYAYVLFYNSVRWLSRGAVLERFVVLLPHIISGKFSLFKVHAESHTLLYFRFTREGEVRTEDFKQVLVGVLDSLQTAFKKRFVDFASIDDVCCFFPSPFTSQPDVCHKLSQTFGVDEAALQEDFIDFKIVPGLKEQFLAAKDDLVLIWATKVPVRFLVLREAAQKLLVLFGNTWSCCI